MFPHLQIGPRLARSLFYHFQSFITTLFARVNVVQRELPNGNVRGHFTRRLTINDIARIIRLAAHTFVNRSFWRLGEGKGHGLFSLFALLTILDM